MTTVECRNILITGKPGSGKTTLVERIAARLGDRAGGFVSKEIRQGGSRTGFAIHTLDGRSGLLARVGLDSLFRVGRYGVQVRDLEALAVPAILEAIRAGKVVVIDEIASMELFSEPFRNAVTSALDSTSPVLATIQVRRIPFLDALRSRRDTRIITLTPENRDRLAEDVFRILSRNALPEDQEEPKP